MTEGYNPLRWDCDRSGCYNQTVRPRIEEFAECFPGKIAMSDIDAVVEISGHFLFFEWKSGGGELRAGQKIMFERLSALSNKITVVVINGHPRTLVLDGIRIIRNGKMSGPEGAEIDALKRRIKLWVARAKGRRVHA